MKRSYLILFLLFLWLVPLKLTIAQQDSGEASHNTTVSVDNQTQTSVQIQNQPTQIRKSNTVVTQVGNPTAPKPTPEVSPSPLTSPKNNGDLASILEWDEKIVDSLNAGIWGYLNKLLAEITNGSYTTGTWAGTNEGSVYWCTYSVIDSYNLAGFSGLSKNQHAAVVNMAIFWKNQAAASQGYTYINYIGDKTTLQSVKPGYSIFMENTPDVHTGNEHVGIIKDISTDNLGNGTITTYESNSTKPTRTYNVVEWHIQNTVFPVIGFGGHS